MEDSVLFRCPESLRQIAVERMRTLVRMALTGLMLLVLASSSAASSPPLVRTLHQAQILEFERVTRDLFARAECRRREIMHHVTRGALPAMRATAATMKAELGDGKERLAALEIPDELRSSRASFLAAADTYVRWIPVMAAADSILGATGNLEEFDRQILALHDQGVGCITVGLMFLAVAEAEAGLIPADSLRPDLVASVWRWWAIQSFGRE